MYLQVPMENPTFVQVRHAFSNLSNDLEGMDRVKRIEALEIRHETAIGEIRANEKPGRVLSRGGRAKQREYVRMIKCLPY